MREIRSGPVKALPEPPTPHYVCDECKFFEIANVTDSHSRCNHPRFKNGAITDMAEPGEDNPLLHQTPFWCQVLTKDKRLIARVMKFTSEAALPPEIIEDNLKKGLT